MRFALSLRKVTFNGRPSPLVDAAMKKIPPTARPHDD